MTRPEVPPLRRTLGESLELPKVLFNPFRLPRKGQSVGKGRAALVIPGLATGDIATTLLRRTLAARGFGAQGWQLGLNTGADIRKLEALETKIAQLHAQTGQQVILIGWSLGGLYARVLAHRLPDHLAMVVTIASPFSGDRHANRAWRFYNLINNHTVDDPPFAEDFSVKPPIPTIAIWSALDGVVLPAATHGQPGETDYCMQVDAPHLALGTTHSCIERIIDAIAIGDGLP